MQAQGDKPRRDVFVVDKRPTAVELLHVRRGILDPYVTEQPSGVVELADPPRNRADNACRSAVRDPVSPLPGLPYALVRTSVAHHGNAAS